MKVAELFVNLGIKGADKAIQGVASVRKSMSEVTSTSLETKAAILGVFYGLEQLTAQSNAFGLAVTQFTNLTGLSGDTLQRWQYLMRQSGVSAEETTSNIVALQKAMAQIVLNRSNPQGITAVSNVVGLDHARIRDTFYMLGKLRDYAKAMKERGLEDVGAGILSSFGLSPSAIQALYTSKVDLKKINPNDLYSEKNIATLNKMSIAWSNLGYHIQLAFGKLNVQFGPRLIADITKLLPVIVHMTSEFAKLADQIKLVEKLGYVFEGWGEIFKGISATIADIRNTGGAATTETLKRGFEGIVGSTTFNPNRFNAAPGAPQLSNTTTNHNTTVPVTVNVTGGPDSHEIGTTIGKQISEHVSRVINNTHRQYQQNGGY